MKTWRLKRGGEKRVRMGHPWVFASELSHSTKEISPGELVELRDFQDHFVAYGYGHPSSQICFRKLSSLSKEHDLLSVDFFRRRLASARKHREAAGWTGFSHRWLFAECDGVPGLIIDAFAAERSGWVVVVQASTAGINRALPEIFEAIQSFKNEFKSLSIVEAPNSRSRQLEGLKVEDKKVVFGTAELGESVRILLRDDLLLQTDLLKGQKTGFFLDQQWNVKLLRSLMPMAKFEGTLRVLDICCYVGQWSAHVAQMGQRLGHAVEVTLVDSSAQALALAERNVREQGAQAIVHEADALKGLANLKPDSYDIVICDPPAFVKKKADLEPGLRAYVKLNRDALRTLKIGGLYVASSCSGLVRGSDWTRVLAEASLKSGRGLKQIAAGGHGPDHPVRPEFPEGEYLKCVIGRADLPI